MGCSLELIVQDNLRLSPDKPFSPNRGAERQKARRTHQLSTAGQGGVLESVGDNEILVS
jgi:hypothetical protein